MGRMKNAHVLGKLRTGLAKGRGLEEVLAV
jgi:hypothetical protein